MIDDRALPQLPPEALDAVFEAAWGQRNPAPRDLSALRSRFPNHATELAAHWRYAMALRATHAPEHSWDNLPRSFDDFRVIGPLGQGGMGMVVEAEQISLARRVAIKVIRDPLSTDLRARFDREVATLATINHRNVVRILGRGTVHGLPYVVMELVQGTTLTAWNPTEPHSEWERLSASVRLALKLARTLADLHELGVVHRDVKPSNIMVTPEQEPVLLDFGLARDDRASRVTLTHGFVGTYQFAAPEQIEGGDVDRRADVFGLGATLFYALTGIAPLKATTPAAHARELAQGRVRSARMLNRSIPRDLDCIVAKALAVPLAERYASCRDMAHDLDAFANGRPVMARRPSLSRRCWQWARRRPAAAALTMACVLLAIAIGMITRAKVAEIRDRRQIAWTRSFEEALALRRGGNTARAENVWGRLCRERPTDPDAWVFRSVNALHRPDMGALANWNPMLEPARREAIASLLAEIPAHLAAEPGIQLLSAWRNQPDAPKQLVVAPLIDMARNDPGRAVRLAAVLERVPGWHAPARALATEVAIRHPQHYRAQWLLASMTLSEASVVGWRAAVHARALHPELPHVAELETLHRFRWARELGESKYPGGVATALDDLRKLTVDHADIGSFSADLGYALAEAKQGDDWAAEAEKSYRHAIACGVDIVGSFNLANLLIETKAERDDKAGVYREVVDLRRNVIAYYGQRFNLWHSLAYCLMQLGRHDEAAEHLRDALRVVTSGHTSLRALLVEARFGSTTPPSANELSAIVREAIPELGASDGAPLGLPQDLDALAAAAGRAGDRELSAAFLASAKQLVPQTSWGQMLRQLAARVDRDATPSPR